MVIRLVTRLVEGSVSQSEGARLACLSGFLILLCVVASSALAIDVEFPGPVPVAGLDVAAGSVAVPWEGEGEYYLAVGSENGFLSLVRLLSGADNFNIFYRHDLGGRVVAVDTWENPDQGQHGVVAATADPDRLHFLQVQTAPPYLIPTHMVELPEDPGSFAFTGPAFPGGRELAVSLPGMDQVAMLLLEDGSWSVSQILAAGDHPRYLASLDLEEDGIRELITAETGVLSGNLGVFRRDQEGGYSRSGPVAVDGWPSLVSAFDIDQDDRPELVVGLSDQPGVLFLEAQDGQLLASEYAALTLPGETLELGYLPGGDCSLFVAVRERGLVEQLLRSGGQWEAVESYYPGCRPRGLAMGDLNGDGIDELVSLGDNTLVTTVMFGRGDGRFWGYPALTLNSAPGSSVMKDFDLDGLPDLLVMGSEQPLLSFFAGQPDGSLASVPVDQDLGYLAGGLVALEAGGSPGPELALLDFYWGQLRILDYDPDLGFQDLTSRTVLPFSTAQLHAADLDDDGHEDIYLARRVASDLLVMFGDGAGNFARDTTMTLTTGAWDALALDLTADGVPDLVATDGLSRVYGFLNQGDGTFGPPFYVQAGSGARFLTSGDLDNDGDLDLVIGNRNEDSLSFLENSSQGTLIRRIGTLALTGTPSGLACGDLDDSGYQDVLVNLGEEGNIGVVFGLGGWEYGFMLRFPGGADISSFMVGDFNLDGYTDILNLDQSLRLGLTMLNLERSLVAVEPSALSYTCEADVLRVKILPDRPGSWTLSVGGAGAWIDLARDGQALAGELDFDGRAWWLAVPWSDLRARGLALSGPLQLELGIGEGGQREFLTLGVEPGCGPLPDPAGLAWLNWDREPWPNPFNPRVQSSISLDRTARVQAWICDLAGRRVATLIQQDLPAGIHTLTWDGSAAGRPVPAGVYFLRVEAPGAVLSRKIMLLK